MGTFEDFAARDTIQNRLAQRIETEYQYPPNVPQNVVVVSTIRQLIDGTTVVDLSVDWDVERELLYDIRVEPTGGDPVMFADVTFAPHVIMAFPTSTALNVYVRGKSLISNRPGAWSNAAGHTTVADTIAPQAPANVVISEISGFTILHITWDAGAETDLRGYVIYRDEFTVPIHEYTRTASNVLDDTHVTAGTTYFYRIKARDATGNLSSFSSQVSQTA